MARMPKVAAGIRAIVVFARLVLFSASPGERPSRAHGAGRFLPCRTIESLIDISRRRQAELAYQESQARLKRLLDNMPGMAYSIEDDDPKTISMVSRGARGFTGFDPETPVGGKRVHKADIRIVAATNRDTLQMVRKGQMRAHPCRRPWGVLRRTTFWTSCSSIAGRSSARPPRWVSTAERCSAR